MKTLTILMSALVILISGSVVFGQENSTATNGNEIAGAKTKLTFTASHKEAAKGQKDKHMRKLISRTDRKADQQIDFWQMLVWDKTTMFIQFNEHGRTFNTVQSFAAALEPWDNQGLIVYHDEHGAYIYMPDAVFADNHPGDFILKWNHTGLQIIVGSKNITDGTNIIDDPIIPPDPGTSEKVSGELALTVRFGNVYGIEGQSVTYTIDANYAGTAKTSKKQMFNWSVKGNNVQKKSLEVVSEE